MRRAVTDPWPVGQRRPTHQPSHRPPGRGVRASVAVKIFGQDSRSAALARAPTPSARCAVPGLVDLSNQEQASGPADRDRPTQGDGSARLPGRAVALRRGDVQAGRSPRRRGRPSFTTSWSASPSGRAIGLRARSRPSGDGAVDASRRSATWRGWRRPGAEPDQPRERPARGHGHRQRLRARREERRGGRAGGCEKGVPMPPGYHVELGGEFEQRPPRPAPSSRSRPWPSSACSPCSGWPSVRGETR